MNTVTEIWKDVVGYEGRYKVSDLGRVFSCKRNAILMLFKNKRGYMIVNLYAAQSIKPVRVHRLVALAFIPNPENKPEVNHRNGIKDDNRLENLEWATPEENVAHAFRSGLCADKAKPITAYLNGEIVKQYSSVDSASRDLKIDQSNIRAHLRGQQKKCKGYTFQLTA